MLESTIGGELLQLLQPSVGFGKASLSDSSSVFSGLSSLNSTSLDFFRSLFFNDLFHRFGCLGHFLFVLVSHLFLFLFCFNFYLFL